MNLQQVETLEPRLLFSAVPLITEFLASNSIGLQDEDGDRSDWIELFNDGDTALDLDGWHLTDDVGNLSKWAFPSVSLDPGAFLVVFASSKDRADSDGTELHTNFKLGAGGEYLALVEADGATIANAFAPTYPTQSTNVSYGMAMTAAGGASVVMPFEEGFITTPTPGSVNGQVASIVINEIHFDPDDSTEQVEFIELYNNSSTSVDLSGWVIDDAVDFVFSGGASIAAGGYVVITQDAAEFQAKFGVAAAGQWETGDRLSNEGENIQLRNAAGQVIDEVNYQLGFPWPTVGEFGSSIELIHPTLDNNLAGSWRSSSNGSGSPLDPTPNAENSVFSTNAAPQLRQLSQSVEQPVSGEDVVVTIKATDPDGVQSVTLGYQLVDPGNYIRLTDAAYDTSWTTVIMHDDGLNGDAVAGDGVYSVTLPGALQTHRRLVRYRITATDTLGASITGPYADDPQPNFAYFVYDGVPDYTASLRPGVDPNVTYAGAQLDDIATYHLIANSTDVNNSQYNGSFNGVQFNGTLVYDGIVYDHIEFRNRGQASTYQVGKNKWKLNFLRGHSFQARDDFGNRYDQDWDKINILPGTNPWWRNDVSTEGTVLSEPVAFRLYELAGTPSPHTQYFQFRIIDDAQEVAPGDQYDGDFWGLYIGIEQPDGRFLDERGLPDGNIFNMHGGVFGDTSQRNQGSELPTDRSDLQDFVNGIDGGFESLAWWQANLDFDSYFAWNIINHAVNNSDIRPDENVNYYHNQETDQWYIVPWDLDLTFEDAPHWFNPVTNREDIRTVLADHPSVRIAYENRLRELQDLLFDNNDAALVVEEYANILQLGTGDQTIVDANQAQWDYHPRKRKQGIWYENFDPGLLPSEDFSGLVTYMQDFLSSGGYGYDLVDGQGDDANIPGQPAISYVGTAGFPNDELSFQTTAFSDPQGAGTFSAMEWRVAEVHNTSVANYDPNRRYVYETEGTWESGTISVFDNQIAIPNSAVESGKTYRARVRMQDSTGRWSRWSDAVEFLAAPPAANDAEHLRITELHYNPAAPTAAEIAAGFTDNDDFEFIELLNTSAGAIELQNAVLSGGVDFTFSNSTVLTPGERVVVVEDTAAFQERYGTSIRIVGQWSGALSNSGETIILTDQAGGTVHQFTYEDGTGIGEEDWPTTPDGDGPSLVVVDTSADYDDGNNWTASNTTHGTPGEDETATLLGDINGDGMVNGQDLAILAANFGSTGQTLATGDITGDGNINGQDLAILAANFGASGAIATATDPDSGDDAPDDGDAPANNNNGGDNATDGENDASNNDPPPADPAPPTRDITLTRPTRDAPRTLTRDQQRAAATTTRQTNALALAAPITKSSADSADAAATEPRPRARRFNALALR